MEGYNFEEHLKAQPSVTRLGDFPRDAETDLVYLCSKKIWVNSKILQHWIARAVVAELRVKAFEEVERLNKKIDEMKGDKIEDAQPALLH